MLEKVGLPIADGITSDQPRWLKSFTPPMSLRDYKRKRDFRRTPEPKPKVAKSRGVSYVIHKHAASHLHYDFRLEMGGVLAVGSIENAATECLRAGADMFLVCRKEEFVVRSYEAVVREAERDAKFARIVQQLPPLPKVVDTMRALRALGGPG